MHPASSPTRRRLLQTAAGLCVTTALPGHAQTGAAQATRPVVAQILDMSPAQQDVSKDVLVGARAAWQEYGARAGAGAGGRSVGHLTLEIDGSPASLRSALASVRDNPACVALSGTAGGLLSSQAITWLRQAGGGLAHAAPWLQDASAELDEQTFPIFATRQAQITHALKSLSNTGVTDVGAIFASPQDFSQYRADVERAAGSLGMRLQVFQPGSDLRTAGQRLTPTTPALLLFVGGTPELAQFAQGLERQQRQRYVVALADVNLQTLKQLGAARSTPIIATQAVPLVTAGLPVVRAYRAALAKYFDEPPTPLSLAGYIGARYTIEVLQGVEGGLTRASALAAFRRRAELDLGGLPVGPQRRASAFVTQSMLATDGRVIG